MQEVSVSTGKYPTLQTDLYKNYESYSTITNIINTITKTLEDHGIKVLLKAVDINEYGNVAGIVKINNYNIIIFEADEYITAEPFVNTILEPYEFALLLTIARLLVKELKHEVHLARLKLHDTHTRVDALIVDNKYVVTVSYSLL